MSDDAGKIVTVEGRIEPSELGVTLPHEHMFSDWSEEKYEPPDSALDRRIADEPISLSNLWWVRKHPSKHKHNLRLNSYDDAVEEVMHFVRAGGDSIVDCTPKDTSGDPEMVRAVGRETGVQFVHGTAFYTEAAHPDRVETSSIDDLADEFTADVTDGIGDTDVRAGLIGEIGMTGRMHENEEKVLRACSRAAVRTGASISIHPPGRTPFGQKDRTYPPSRWGLDIVDIAEEEGLPADRVVLCHMDRSCWYEDLSYQEELAERGAYVEYDLFGQEMYFEDYADACPSDVQRVDYLVELIEAGYADRLLLSQDVFLNFQRKKYGGNGYSHVLENIQPILRGKGVSEDVLDQLFVENPARMLTFAEPE